MARTKRLLQIAAAVTMLALAGDAQAKVLGSGIVVNAQNIASTETVLMLKGTATSVNFSVTAKQMVAIHFSAMCLLSATTAVEAQIDLDIRLNGVLLTPTQDFGTTAGSTDFPDTLCRSLGQSSYMGMNSLMVPAMARAGGNSITITAKQTGTASQSLLDSITVVVMN